MIEVTISVFKDVLPWSGLLLVCPALPTLFSSANDSEVPLLPLLFNYAIEAFEKRGFILRTCVDGDTACQMWTLASWGSTSLEWVKNLLLAGVGTEDAAIHLTHNILDFQRQHAKMAMWIFSEGRHVFSFIALNALFASVFVIAKKGLMYSQPLFFLGSACFLQCDYATLPENCPEKTDWNHQTTDSQTLPPALFNIYLTKCLRTLGITIPNLHKTCLILQLIPLSFRLFCYALFAEKWPPKKWVGLAVGFVGPFPPNSVSTIGWRAYNGTLSFALLGRIFGIRCRSGKCLRMDITSATHWEKSNYNISCKRIQHDRRRSPCSHSLLPHRKMDTLSRNRLSIF